MMECLSHGGLDVFSSNERENKMQYLSDEDYTGNDTFFELDNYKNLNQYNGKLIKVIGGRYIDLPVDSKIVIMIRHPEEIRQSFEALTGKVIDYNTFTINYAKILKLIKNNKRLGDIVFSYRNLLKSPRKHFKKLFDLGWPIDIKKAASQVDGSKCRFKIENLEVGI